MAETVEIEASPTKQFFVSILTRDIELEDAVLDLLDNCLDGVWRSHADPQAAMASESPYQSYQASITVRSDRFVIVDNCGGIPRDTAVNYAFRLGRETDSTESLPTIGMYGIGMKRAIFKIGRDATVESDHQGDGFAVRIDPTWFEQADNWKLPLENTPPEGLQGGTRITITKLLPDIRNLFIAGEFENSLRQKISQQYAIIIEKGFKVEINGIGVNPVPLTILSASDLAAETAVAPYYLAGEVNGVNVQVVAGFYRGVPTRDEVEPMIDSSSSSARAGWTVACNDRVVIYRDKTTLTGWGEANVPLFHNQFIAFSGLVLMQSVDPRRLPLTTTKRGIDASSETYLLVKNYMREATRIFTSFTNQWKGASPKALERVFQETSSLAMADLAKLVDPSFLREVRKLDQGRRFAPSLPVPPKATAGLKRISYRKTPNDIEAVARFLLGTDDSTPSEVGEACFDDFLRRAGRTRRDDDDVR